MGLPKPSRQKVLPTRLLRLNFVELLARTNFSFLQGASHPEEMVEEAIRHDYQGIGICDLHGLYGVARGFQTATAPSAFSSSLHAKDGFKYHFGVELILDDETQIAVLPMNKKGYTNLCALITIGKRNAPKGFSRIQFSNLLDHQEDLICFLIEPKSEELFQQFNEVFQDRLYIPVWRDFSWASTTNNRMAFYLEKKLHAQLFVTNRPFMHSRERKPVFDAVTCLLHKTNLEEANHILPHNSERYLRPAQDLTELWKDRPDLVQITCEISARLHFQLDEIRYRYPKSKLPQQRTPAQHLESLAIDGLNKRFPQGIPQKILGTVKHELKLIQELEFEDYFLTLHEICQFAKAKGILYQGRGSAANSVVCFAIGLTSVDPTEIDLLFERFISKERGEPPDIDIDFEHERREEVIQHIYQTYDEHHAAMVCTVIRYRSRMAFREVAKVFSVPLATVNRIIKFMGRDGMRRLKETENIHDTFQIPKQKWTLLLAVAQELHGFPRHLGIHTGGFIITQDRLSEMVPVEKASMDGRYVIQWNKDDVQFLKLMKIDVLSLGMLSCLRKAFNYLLEQKNIRFDLASIPRDDKKTYDMICKAETVGVFQIESRAQMNTLPRLLPKNYYDLVIEVALVRPGPLQGGMVHPFLRRRQGLEKVTYPLPSLESILKKTEGVPIFQEQVMKIVVAAAGFSPGEADELRRVMSNSWRGKGTMDGIRDRIMTGLQKSGIKQKDCEGIYKTIEGFANYGFPESHAASFALLTYASSYLKCHHPEIFVASLLNSQPMGFYSPRVLISEAQQKGVRFLPLDLNQSDWDYTFEKSDDGVPPEINHPAVRVGFRSLYGISEKIIAPIIQKRNQFGPFLDLTDFVQRTGVSKIILAKLAASGALAFTGLSSLDLLWKIEAISTDQNSFLFGQPKEAVDESPMLFESNWHEMQRLYDHQGFAVHTHPMKILRTSIQRKNEELALNKFIPYFSSEDLKSKRSNSKLRVAGLISITQRPPTAKGMCFITLEDEFGFMNIVIPPDVYQKDRQTIYERSLIEVHGSLEINGAIRNLKATRVLPFQLKQ